MTNYEKKIMLILMIELIFFSTFPFRYQRLSSKSFSLGYYHGKNDYYKSWFLCHFPRFQKCYIFFTVIKELGPHFDDWQIWRYFTLGIVAWDVNYSTWQERKFSLFFIKKDDYRTGKIFTNKLDRSYITYYIYYIYIYI